VIRITTEQLDQVNRRRGIDPMDSLDDRIHCRIGFHLTNVAHSIPPTSDDYGDAGRQQNARYALIVFTGSAVM